MIAIFSCNNYFLLLLKSCLITFGDHWPSSVNFFKDLCSTTLRQEDLNKMKANIPVILCKLERIFPPAFFDVMEHLPIHLIDEARNGGPVQYRWMYPFER